MATAVVNGEEMSELGRQTSFKVIMTFVFGAYVEGREGVSVEKSSELITF